MSGQSIIFKEATGKTKKVSKQSLKSSSVGKELWSSCEGQSMIGGFSYQEYCEWNLHANHWRVWGNKTEKLWVNFCLLRTIIIKI